MAGQTRKQMADRKLKEAYENHYVSVYRYCLSRLKSNDMAEDCVQEAFLVLYNKLLDGEEIELVKQFLLKTASNFVLKKFEEVKKAQTTVDIEEVIHIPTQNEDIDERLTFEEYSRQISAALSTLDAEIFRLKYVEDYRIEDISNKLDMTVCSVTKRLSRIRKKLREIFGDRLK